MAVIRTTEIHARRTRKKKMRKLRESYRAATTPSQREKIAQKASRVAPWIPEAEFVKLAKAK
jgi:hypothetical protein